MKNVFPILPGAAAVAVLLMAAAAVRAQDYPAKTVRIVTSEIGGANDFQSRVIALGLAGPLGQQVIVDNRATGVIVCDVVAKATPDGYTVLLYSGALWIGPLMQTTPYDAVKDFLPVTQVARAPNFLVVNPALPAKSVAELVALARARPGELNYGSSGNGASNHLSGELFKSLAGVNIVRVNYRGTGLALNALIAGELQVMFPTASSALPHVRSGKVRLLAVTSAEPSALAPNIPTLAAAGLPGYDSTSIAGVFAPAGTPRSIVGRLNREIVLILGRADVKEKFFNSGMEAVSGTPEQLASLMSAEIARMGKVIRAAGIRVE